MSQTNNIYEISQQVFDESYSQHQICDKSCQKQLFQSRNQNVQNGLLGDNSFILSQVEVIEDQIKPDQLDILETFNDKIDQFKEYVDPDQKNKQQTETNQQQSTKSIKNQQQDQLNTQMSNLAHFEGLQNAKQNQYQYPNETQMKSSKQQDQSRQNNSILWQLDQQNNKGIILQNNNKLNKYLNLIKKFQQRIKIRKDGVKNRQQQLLLIDDLSNIDQFQKQSYNKNKQYGLINQLSINFNQIPIISPTFKLIIIWDIFSLINFTVFYFLLSIVIFFNSQPVNSKAISYICLIALSLLFFEMIINCNIAYFEEGFFVKERKKIIQKYIFSFHFHSDFISTISLLIKIINESLQNNQKPNCPYLSIYNYLIFLKIYGLYIKQQKLEKHLQQKYQFNCVYEIAKSIFHIIALAHIVSIGWYIQSYIYSTYYPESLTWIKTLQVQESEYYIKYIYSFYWAISTLTTVGNGYLTAYNFIEAFYASISIITFSLFFAYYANCLGFIFQNNFKEKKKFQNNIYQMNSYLSSRQIDPDLKYKINQNLSSTHKNLKDQYNIEESPMFSSLPKKLREEIQIQINTNMLKNFNFFQNLSQKSQYQILFILQEMVIPQDEILFKEGDLLDNSVYIIQDGSIQIYQQKSEYLQTQISILCNLNKNQSFGEVSFFTGLARSASAKAIKTSIIYKLDRKQFIEIIKQNQGDFEYFKMIQDKIIYSKNFTDLKIDCYSCQQKGHILKYCPQINQKLNNKINTLTKQNQFKQKRQYRDRKQFKSFNAKHAIKLFRKQGIENIQNDQQISMNNPKDNEYYSFQQIQLNNQQVAEPFLQFNNLQSVIKKQNFKETIDKSSRKSQQIQQDQNLSDINIDFKQEISIQDHVQGFEMQESQMKVIKNKNKSTSFQKNLVTNEINSISDIIMITNSKINIQHDEETLNVTSNLISDFQIKDLQKVKKPITPNQKTQNNELQTQSCKNQGNRCSADVNSNSNCLDMILNTNGQFIYDQIEDQVQSSINLSYQESVNKQQTKIESSQLSPCKCQKNKLFETRLSKQNEQNELDQTLQNIKFIFSKYDSEQPFNLQIDSIKKYRYYFPTHNYDLILKQYQKYLTKKKNKFQQKNQ
ncbi:cyclic nucleotide-binding domain protein (macronuclear) [Tetrahymena thermophila SB210]|uniref:Cyclic nucleotide-binding domain protein n=1 Tax=Tetrahymena thermophila (strain SB210) TaxID=312017 RepID=W7X8W2_TETTS|nr:cyclic nucleotide-binding domain protein [Tetrahymena thermophila SB210]EWS75805.1 cyclic nucleotide-binding domain protein [Tetrahymena thermophila SB210]|eukprot:XP_012651727.1 cyclic nucleotide-binding domain protein [Tetrahymena thermophila SB210]